MQRWQYLRDEVERAQLDEKLTQLGSEGWEFVAVCYTAPNFLLPGKLKRSVVENCF